MSRVFSGAAGNLLDYFGAIGVTGDCTVFAWVKQTTGGSNQQILQYSNTSAQNLILNIQAANTLRCQANQQFGGANAITTGTISTNTWTPVIGTYATADSKSHVYALGESITGGNAGTFTAESSPALSIGDRHYSGGIAPINGKVAYVALWESALGSTDRASLLAGADPATISTGTLFDSWALTGSSLVGVNGHTLTVTGTVTSDTGDNPTVGSSGPTLSGGSPTGTVGPSPTVGFTTSVADTNAKRIVIDSAANLSGVTNTQVLAGNKAAGTAAAYDSGNITTNSTSISAVFAGLPSGTYTAAAAHTGQTGSSAAYTWTFTVDATAPNFTAGPTVSAIASTTATIGLTSSETGYGAVIATSTAASQPADAAFDAVQAAVTAATPATSNQTSLTAAALQKFWVQIKDAYGNRATTSVIGLTSHTGYSRVTIGTPNTTAANRLTATPDIAAGDIIDWGDIVGTGTVVVNSDGTFDADVGVTAFTIYVGNTTDGWGSSAVQAVGGVVSTSTLKAIRSAIRSSIRSAIRAAVR